MDKVNLVSDGGISTITLNRPGSYNSLDLEMIKQLASVLKEVQTNNDRVVVLTGAGKAFCAGGDVKMMSGLKLEFFDEMMDALTEISTTLYTMPKIVISAVNGSAAGLGFSLALASDYIVAQKKAQFGMLFAGIGLIPDGGGHFFLKEKIGTHKAKQFIWSMEQVNAETALKMGFVDYVVDDNLEEFTNGIASKFLMSPFKAIIRTKRMYHESKREELLHYLEAEKAGQLEATQTKDHKEGVQAFIEKKVPKFIGE